MPEDKVEQPVVAQRDNVISTWMQSDSNTPIPSIAARYNFVLTSVEWGRTLISERQATP